MRFSNKKITNSIAVVVVVALAYLFNDGEIPLGESANQGGRPASSSPKNMKPTDAAMAGDFDHYLMALSWSPTFCADNGKNNKEQCGANRNYAFVVHGLWPQYDRGGWPDFCDAGGPGRVPERIVDDVIDIMPSRGLIGHQWKKHGTCTGLDIDAYFDAVREAYGNIIIPNEYRSITKPLKTSPDAIRGAFAAANPGLDENAIGLTCDNRLREVRICMSKSLEFQACAKSAKRCKSKSVVLLPSRG